MACPTMPMDVSVGKDFLTWLLDVLLLWLDISDEEYKYLHGGYAYNHLEKGLAL